MPGAGGQQPQRTTFRPPWVKDGPSPLPMPTVPWTLNSRRDSKPTEEPPAFTKVTLKSVAKPAEVGSTTQSGESAQPRKQSKITIVPTQVSAEKSKTKSTASSENDNKTSTSRKLGKSDSTSRPQLERQVRLDRSRSRSGTDNGIPLAKSESITGAPTLSKSSSRAAIPPPPPPRPPPPPPSRTVLKDLPPLTDTQKKTLEMFKSRPRKRPDWASMMKEVESGKKLRHVKCNDRSAPIIERVSKVKAPAGPEHFIFESEKSNMHNKLLQQIQEGIKLKSVKTNDRSRPNLTGLRKFRRQLTIEEQMQKADAAPVEETIPDEMDDIDAVRDDLQSTKQMLALELRNKEALERDNKRLQARILNLEAENERVKLQQNVQEYKKQDEQVIVSLKKEAEQARKETEKLEKDFATVAEERDKTKLELEEIKRMYAALERRMKAGMALAGCPSAKDVARIASQKSIDKAGKDEPEEVEEEEEEEEETSEDEDDNDPEAAAERRLLRELKLLNTKIRNFKDKEVNAKKERYALKEQIKQQQKMLKEERKKFKSLQKEVDKMAKLMADTDDEDEEEEEEEEVEEEKEETESEEESESESEESEDEELYSDDEAEEMEKRKCKLQDIAKKHEGRLSSLKKGNYLLKAQVDRLKDDLVKQREDSISLQEDLDSVLAELG